MNENNQSGVIEIRIRELAQIFNSLDPSPFHGRDLDDDAEEYIVSWARELPSNVPITLIIHLPIDEAQKARERQLDAAISNYFGQRASLAERDLKELFRFGWRCLSIGVPVLAACLAASQLAGATLGGGPMARTIEESLIIVGWVANWKPIEMFLYDWWPLKRRSDLYRRLSRATLAIKEH